MTTQGRRRRADLPEGTPERDPSGRTARRNDADRDGRDDGREDRRDGGRDSSPRGADRAGRADRADGGKQKRPTLEPMVINESKVIWIGIAVWAAAFAVMVPFRKSLIADGHGWWLYTCLAGAGLGMMGLPLVRRRKHVMEQEVEHGATRTPRSAAGTRPPRDTGTSRAPRRR